MGRSHPLGVLPPASVVQQVAPRAQERLVGIQPALPYALALVRRKIRKDLLEYVIGPCHTPLRTTVSYTHLTLPTKLEV